jgi:hypothetical protein
MTQSVIIIFLLFKMFLKKYKMLKTRDGVELNIEELTWDDTYILIKNVLPGLSKILESFDNDEFKFYKARYSFGERILHDQQCYLSNVNGESISFNDEILPDNLKCDLSYNKDTEDPLGLVLSKKSELYMETGSRIMSHAIANPGYLFGVPRAIEPMEMPILSHTGLNWNLNAGARSVFFLTKISAKLKHEKLIKTLKLKSEAPENVEMEWSVFKEIAKNINSRWCCEVLFFPRGFINRLKQMESFQLSNYFMRLHRSNYNIWHNTALIWNAVFSEIEQKKHLTHYSMYSIFNARQLFLIAANSAIGFKPIASDASVPYLEIKDLYNEVYGLREDKQSDIMMESANLDLSKNDAIYYSINNPMLAEYNPDTFKGKSLIALLDEIYSIVNAYQTTILADHIQVESLYKVANTTTFTFFHSNTNEDTYPHINNVETLAKEDARFTVSKQQQFPITSAFFKGCIRISREVKSE